MNDNNDDLKQEQSNEIIEIPKTIEAKAEVTTPVIQEEVKASKQNKRTVIKEFPKKKSGMKAGTKTQLIILGVTLIFWIFLASSVISFIKSIGRRSKESQIIYSQINYNTSQPAPVENTPATTVPEPVNNTAVPPSIPETNNNVAPQQNTQQYSSYDDYDLQVLDKVYDEVINRGNESYLYNFSSSELAIIRNTLYARRGYRFKKKKYQQYFGSKPWYTPTTDSQNILPKNEERLANIIKKYE